MIEYLIFSDGYTTLDTVGPTRIFFLKTRNLLRTPCGLMTKTITKYFTFTLSKLCYYQMHHCVLSKIKSFKKGHLDLRRCLSQLY